MTEVLFKYYGIDWLFFILALTNLWLIGNQNKLGFVIGIINTVVGITFGIMIQSAATPLMHVIFAGMNIRGFLKWRTL